MMHIARYTQKERFLSCDFRLRMKIDETQKVLFLSYFLKPLTYIIHISPVITLLNRGASQAQHDTTAAR